MSQFNKKYLHYSFAFYSRDNILKDVHSAFLKMDKLAEHEKLLKKQSVDTFLQFNQGSLLDQRKFIQTNGEDVFLMLFDMVENVNHDKMLMQYVIPTIDGILVDDRKNYRFIKKIISQVGADKAIFSQLSKILLVDGYSLPVYEAAARVASFILGELDKKDNQQKQRDFLLLLLNIKEKQRTGAKIKIENYNLITSLVNLLKHDHLIESFLNNGGADILHDSMTKFSNELQPMYYTLLALWLISFSPLSYDYFKNPNLGLIRLSTEVILKISREKIIRVAFSCYKQLCLNSKDSIEMMVDVELLKIVDTLLKGNLKDKELIDDIQFVGEVLEKNIKILSSFEKYCKEIHLQCLEWTPVHSEKFWKENVKKFEENDFHLIKKLVELLDSDREKNVSIACYDLGEFCRFHPFGRQILESLKGKEIIMNKARGGDQTIREHALLALQKIMLHNWSSINK